MLIFTWMNKILAFLTFLFVSAALWSQERELNLGIYGGGGFRKNDAFLRARYNAGFGVESGVTYRRTSTGKKFRMVYNLGYTYDYFDVEENDALSSYRVWHRVGGLELLARPEFRLIGMERFSMYVGAGLNLDRFISYFVKYKTVYYNPYQVSEKDWDHQGHREEFYFGFHTGLAADLLLTEKIKLGLDISLVSRLRLEFSSSSQYTGQNFRVSVVRVF